MKIHLVRHARAGSRSSWDRADELRPLSTRGQRQANAIDDQLRDAGIDLLWSSTYVRCRQTFEPLAATLGLDIVDSQAFTEGGDGPSALDAMLAAAAAGHTLAVCSHGDVIPAVVEAAMRRGAKLDGPPTLSKGARYECKVSDGKISLLRAFPAAERRA